jgi:hypothetical protein
LLLCAACRHANQITSLVTHPFVSYVGGMVTHHTAKVSRRRVVIRGVDLPDGTTVTVSIRRGIPELVLPPEEAQALDEALAEADRGEWVSGDAIEGVRAAFRRAAERTRPASDRRRRAVVGAKPRRRAKPARGAAR